MTATAGRRERDHAGSTSAGRSLEHEFKPPGSRVPLCLQLQVLRAAFWCFVSVCPFEHQSFRVPRCSLGVRGKLGGAGLQLGAVWSVPWHRPLQVFSSNWCEKSISTTQRLMRNGLGSRMLRNELTAVTLQCYSFPLETSSAPLAFLHEADPRLGAKVSTTAAMAALCCLGGSHLCAGSAREQWIRSVSSFAQPHDAGRAPCYARFVRECSDTRGHGEMDAGKALPGRLPVAAAAHAAVRFTAIF